MQTRHPRRPDGTREIQGLDDLIREAVQDLPIHRLPGGGAPIDLSTYFASSPEQRVGNKLLSDNQMLPQPLAQRRRLEQHLVEAEGFFRGQRPILRRMLRHAAAQARLFAGHGNTDQLRSLLEPFSLPLCFERKVTGEANAPKDVDRILVDADALVQSVERYNRTRADVAKRYRQFIREAGRIVEGIRRYSAWERALQPVPIPNPDLPGLLASMDREFPALPIIPRDLVASVKDYRDCPSRIWWRRLLDFS